VAFNVGASLFNDLFYMGVTRGVQQAARSLGYNIVLADFTAGIPDIIRNRDTDGIIFFQDLEWDLLNVVRDLSVPFVVADSHIANAPYPTVGVDHRLASYAAVKYLLEMGHREIAFLGPHKGYTQALLERGIIPRREYTIASGETTSGAAEGVERLLKQSPRATAIFCSGDRLAVGAMLRVQEEGWKVPEEISFISIDDTMLCRYVRPMLSTVHIDMESLGAQAMLLLKQLLDGGPSENRVLVMDQVVERNSVKRAI
jgi:DNA-binding LacI/PurR family transcriptional regulator